MADDAVAVQNEPVDQATTPTDSAPVETKAPEVEDEQGKADKEVAESLSKQETEDEDSTEEESEEEKPVEETDSEEKPPTKAEDRKQQLNTEIRDLVSQRNALRTQFEAESGKVYQPATEQDLLDQVNPETGEYFNPLEAKVAAMEQRQEIERYNNQVTEGRLTLTSEGQRAINDFPMFDETSPEYKPEIDAQVDAIVEPLLIRDTNIPEVDPATGQPTGKGMIIGSRAPVYPIYKLVADAAKASAEAGQIKGQQATDEMQSRADSTSSAAPPKEKENLFLKGLLGENQN